MPAKVSKGTLTPSEREALDRLVRQLRSQYAERLNRVILYGYRNRGPQGSDLDVLVVIEGMKDRKVEMGHIQRMTAPFTLNENILITAIPVDTVYLEEQHESNFFAGILKDGLIL